MGGGNSSFGVNCSSAIVARADEVAARGLGPWSDIEVLGGASTGPMAALNVSYRVATRLSGGESY